LAASADDGRDRAPQDYASGHGMSRVNFPDLAFELIEDVEET